MGSSFAERFNATARPKLWAEHSEIVTLRIGDASTDLRVIWNRIEPEVPDTDGIGVQGYTGEVNAIVKVADLAAHPGPTAFIVRNGEKWNIRSPMDRQDDWTWVMRLVRPDVNLRTPQRNRG